MQSILVTVGQDMKAARERAGLSQQQVADVFGWGRDAISKAERGIFPLKLIDYLALVRFLEHAMPADHPAVALSKYFLAKAKSAA